MLFSPFLPRRSTRSEGFGGFCFVLIHIYKCSVFVREDKVKEICLSWGANSGGGPVFIVQSQAMHKSLHFFLLSFPFMKEFHSYSKSSVVLLLDKYNFTLFV